MRIERLRGWLLASAVLLLAVVAGFIGTARYVRRHLLAKAIEKLGADVKVDSNGITWSHTNGKQTDYVIHAAKEVEHTDGKVALHDVWIKLCGREQRRADMVRGDEWEWDQKSGVIRAVGVVHIELRAGAGQPGCSASDDAGGAEAEGTKAAGGGAIQATTSDLIYMQKLGLAATSAPIEFEAGAMRGHAVGADYASDSGQLMLHSAVSMMGVSAGQPVAMNAASAEMDGQERLIRLTGARYATGASDPKPTATAEHALLHLRADQTLERIEAQGDVTLEANGGTVHSAKADAAMNAAGHPVSALLTGGVRYVAVGPLEERRGEAQEAAIQFDGKASPQAQHAVFTGGAHFQEKTRADATKTAWNTRELAAAKLDVVLAVGADGKNEVRDAEGVGGANFSEVNAGAGTGRSGAAAGAASTEIAADDLRAHFATASGAGARARPQVETLSGRGHTLVRQVNAAGVEQTSAGDTLDARFRQSAGGAAKKAANEAARDFASDLASAVQSGHVVVTRREPAKSGKSGDEERATAQQAVYDGGSQRATLSGGVELTDAGSRLWASQLVLERVTGNAQAAGPVKVEYVQESGGRNAVSTKNGAQDAEPVHVLAERAELDRAKDTVTFHGAPARMWRSGSQVQAPVIVVERTAKRLVARGESSASATAQVQTMLMSASTDAVPGKGPAAAPGCAVAAGAGGSKAVSSNGGLQTVRIASGGLEYSQEANEADFTGGFRAETSDAEGVTTVRASEGKVYMKSTKTGTQSPAPSLQGSVDRMVASGQVAVDRPGLRATGGRLVYTSTDRRLLLTGDGRTLPRATDGKGNVTSGAALEFLRACNGVGGDTVEVLNAVPGEPGKAAGVHTEVRADAKQERTGR